MSSTRLLLLSNSRSADGSYLEHARGPMRDLLDGSTPTVLFVPYAGVNLSADAYASRVREALAPIGCRLVSLHACADPASAVAGAEAIAVGGGNTFVLLRRLYEARLLGAIRERVLHGVPYIGWSAGSVVACPTIGTTNDMPIAMPPSLDALALVPFQINAHYTDAHPPGHQGETRAERIAEYLVLHPGTTVVGLREGSALQVRGDRVRLVGGAGARVFSASGPPREREPGSELSLPGQAARDGEDGEAGQESQTGRH